jgi:hypothetical protein
MTRLRKKLKDKTASLADDFDFRMLVVIYSPDYREPPRIFEAERVAVYMSNNAEKSIMKGVQDGRLEEADV